jgi:hypothetical protein
MANFFGMLKPNQIIWFDGILLGVGGAAHLLPVMLKPVVELAIPGVPITLQMVVGALAVARAIDLMFIRR